MITSRVRWRGGESGDPAAGLGAGCGAGLGARTSDCGRFAGVTVAVEPTGHRWRVVGQLAAERNLPFVSVQPLMSSWARRAEDLTFDKTDDKEPC